jgi:hypothetical protein
MPARRRYRGTRTAAIPGREEKDPSKGKNWNVIAKDLWSSGVSGGIFLSSDKVSAREKEQGTAHRNPNSFAPGLCAYCDVPFDLAQRFTFSIFVAKTFRIVAAVKIKAISLTYSLTKALGH